jgi:hypothetical protein
MSRSEKRGISSAASIASLVFGAVLTAVPLLSVGSRLGGILARPGWWLSSALGANDKWGLPALLPYAVGGITFWGLVTFAAWAGLVTLRGRGAPPSN